jgi:hypothetical protein
LEFVKKFTFNNLQGGPFAKASAENATLKTGRDLFCLSLDVNVVSADCPKLNPGIEVEVVDEITGKWRKPTS